MDCYLKRALPFIFTLSVGTALAGWLIVPPRPAANSNEPGRVKSSYPGTTSTDRRWTIINSQPEAEYPAAARRDGVTGRVRLRVLLAADGKVAEVVPVEVLPGGLTEAAVGAAWRIKFTPALRNGTPVSVWVEIVHEFKDGAVLSYCREGVYEELFPETDGRP
jgi:vitamin B12 transporter